MSIDLHPASKKSAAAVPSTWGDIAAEGSMALVVRFALVDRVVTYPVSELRRWEHVVGETEALIITAGTEQIVIEGHELAKIRAALDFGRLNEVRINFTRPTAARLGPCVSRIAIEPT